ncbi:WecB/TagA/CpsF family glycosyltransferase [Aeromonas allosaccharophila]
MLSNKSIRVPVIGVGIDVIAWPTVLEWLSSNAQRKHSSYICITNVHSVVTATQDPAFGEIVQGADMVTPDGAPVAWMLRKLGHANQERINGPDLMWKYCALAAERGESIYLYGGTPETLSILQGVLANSFPELKVAGAYSPPFRPLTQAEDEEIISRINASGAGSVWVSLGCPKQEKWMADHRGKINAVMVGVGAAFDYHAGTIKRAPLWMQHAGLEWLHRLCSEPRRLWRRYFVTNSLFILLAGKQLLARR